jgi:hypothetical protein
MEPKPPTSQHVSHQTLLRLVSRGNAIVAEIRRLSGYIPEEFVDRNAYQRILVDFSYFHAAEKFEETIESSVVSSRPVQTHAIVAHVF